jgi:UDP-N-acetylmuramate-alanine ligase
VTGALLAAEAERAGAPAVHYHEALAQLEGALASELRSGDLCVAMGAGDIDAAVRRVHRQLQRGEA